MGIAKDEAKSRRNRSRTKKTSALFIILLMCIHNFPEGVAVYLSVLRGVASGAGICFAIALHNIPEGVVVASPVYAASGSRWIAMKYALIAGLCEPLGAVCFSLLFKSVINYYVVHSMLASVAAELLFIAVYYYQGMMVHLSFSELIPETFSRIGE